MLTVSYGSMNLISQNRNFYLTNTYFIFKKRFLTGFFNVRRILNKNALKNALQTVFFDETLYKQLNG